MWEETAAKHVTIKAQLAAIAGLATRWRRLELTSWRGTLAAVARTHAAGAHRLWFHLHQLLLIQPLQATLDAAPDTAPDAAPAGAAAATDAAPAWFKGTVSTLEAFMQTSTIGEYSTRLQLLRSFAAQICVRLEVSVDAGETAGVEAGEGSLPVEEQRERLRRLHAAVLNVCDYYAQFQPAIDKAIKVRLYSKHCHTVSLYTSNP